MKRLQIVLLAAAVAVIAIAVTHYIIRDENNSLSESSARVRGELSPPVSVPDPNEVPTGNGTRSDSFSGDERQPMPDGWK
ncbi:hypothetical protein [Burkholderia sp. RF4-BP95]|uniref:hypothetical protein n=1 Tax=Burkholderia sp. RF4-BP95 TaxID=1637845 RepID=UPI0012E3E020|nr:hypothetical protein [Burkholderia sp. RF4-BP95]